MIRPTAFFIGSRWSWERLPGVIDGPYTVVHRSDQHAQLQHPGRDPRDSVWINVGFEHEGIAPWVGSSAHDFRFRRRRHRCRS